MFLTLGYVYMTKLMIIHEEISPPEITKNIYSLYYLQVEEIIRLGLPILDQILDPLESSSSNLSSSFRSDNDKEN